MSFINLGITHAEILSATLIEKRNDSRGDLYLVLGRIWNDEYVVSESFALDDSWLSGTYFQTLTEAQENFVARMTALRSRTILSIR